MDNQEQVPLREGENEFFEQFKNEQNHDYADKKDFDVSPLRNSAYSVKESAQKQNRFQEDEIQKSEQSLKSENQQEEDNEIHLQSFGGGATADQNSYPQFSPSQNMAQSQDMNQEQLIKNYQLYQRMMQQACIQQQQQQQQSFATSRMPQSQPTQINSQQLTQSQPQSNSQSQIIRPQSQQMYVQEMSQGHQRQLEMIQRQQAQSNQSVDGQQAMFMQIIAFYDKNLNNLKSIVVQKDQDLQAKDNKIQELTNIIYQMKSQFQVISQKYETENQELMKRYLATMDEFGTKKLDDEHRTINEREQMMIEFVQLKQQYIELNSKKMNLEILVKDHEVRHQSDQIRINDFRIKVEYLENEIRQLESQRNLVDQQNQQLIYQFEQLKQQQLQNEQQRLQQQSYLIQSQQQSQSKLNLSSISIQPAESQRIAQIPSYGNLNFNNKMAPPQSQQQYLQYEVPQQQVQGQQRSQLQQPLQQQQQQQAQQQQQQAVQKAGIMSFPSDQKYYNQMDEIQVLYKDLQDYSFKKQQIESELNKKIQMGKTMQERKKREQQEREVEELTEQISKVKLKLREFRQV